VGPRQEAPPRPPTGIIEFRIDWERCIKGKLVTEKARVRILGRYHFLVFSGSEHGVGWAVDLEPNKRGEVRGCSCREWHHRNEFDLCWHHLLCVALVKRMEEWG
jgi:hypothetical protein